MRTLFFPKWRRNDRDSWPDGWLQLPFYALGWYYTRFHSSISCSVSVSNKNTVVLKIRVILRRTRTPTADFASFLFVTSSFSQENIAVALKLPKCLSVQYFLLWTTRAPEVIPVLIHIQLLLTILQWQIYVSGAAFEVSEVSEKKNLTRSANVNHSTECKVMSAKLGKLSQ